MAATKRDVIIWESKYIIFTITCEINIENRTIETYSENTNANLPGGAAVRSAKSENIWMKTLHYVTKHTDKWDNVKVLTSAAPWHGPADRNRAIKKYSSAKENKTHWPTLMWQKELGGVTDQIQGQKSLPRSIREIPPPGSKTEDISLNLS